MLVVVRRRQTVLLTIALAFGACSPAPQAAPAPEVATSAPTLAIPAETAVPVAASADHLRCTERVALPAIPDIVDVRWAPDSSALAVVRFVRVPSKLFITGYEEQRRLSIVDPSTGALHDVEIATHPEWSGSGGYLSFWRDENKSKVDELLRIVRGDATVGYVDSTQPDGRWIGDELLFWYDNEIRAWKDGQTRTVTRVDTAAPIFPADDTAFSADGERFTLTRYTLKGEVRRYVGLTRTGQLTPIEDPGVAYTEWSTRGATLLLRSADHVMLRSADGAQRTLSVPSGTVHGWTADGRLLLGAMSPTIPGGNAFDRFTVVGSDGAVATLPNLMGARSISPDGQWFAGVSRTGIGSTQLELYRCGTAASTDLRADPLARARVERIESDTLRLVRPVAGAVAQHVQGRHTGVDVAAPLGAIVYADDDGIVNAAEWVPVGGYRVCVMHAGSLESCAYHSALSLVKVGERVSRGQPIALVGMTGITTGPHTHWEVKLDGKVVDPLAH